MQETNRFFQFLWRVNAIAIAGVAALAVVIGIYAIYAIVREEARDRNTTETLIIDANRLVQEETVLGVPRTIAGTKTVRIPLYREQKTDVSYYSKTSGANTINELVVDSTTGKSDWLFKDSKRLVLNSTDVFDMLNVASPRARAIVYSLVEQDSNGDGRLSASDKLNIGYSNAETANFVPLLDNVEKLFSLQQVADDRLMVIYIKNGENRLLTYALPAFTIHTDTPLPKLEDAR